MKFIPGFLLLLLLMGCVPDKPSRQSKEGKSSKAPQKSTQLKISIQPFADLSPGLAARVLKGIKEVYPFCELEQPIPLPKSAYYPPRNRYRADSLIGFLGKVTPSGVVTIGLTCKDISTTKNGKADWGIMGLGFCPGNACIVSTYRLNKKNLESQLYKVALHELGHTQGLPHCPDKTCYMLDAEGGNPTDQETGFCPKCKTKLNQKGWQL